MEGTHPAAGDERTVLVRPNCSLSPAGRQRFLLFIALVALGIGLAFAGLGAWPVLPFAGLEVGVLFLAFRYLERHAADYEQIRICGDHVLVECREADTLRRYEFNRHWVRLVTAPDGPGGLQLRLRSHGREVELGRCLGPAAREALLRELRIHLH